MKQLFIFLQLQFRRIFPSKLDRINRKLSDAYVDISAERKQLRADVDAYMMKAYRIGSLSEFIPRKGVSNLKVFNDIQLKFGKQMRACNQRLTYDLRWK
ncbi:hypothetical protein [Leeuwenhoekiella marinoflava]|uniref:Uncharacterized protein n=2 Tax=Leeuwenhoekiella marinoflava TaxID=988 RepID=A0A4Q0PNF9_9FLAO|nr:hypothetical protein [Leeuwenhoekiella marinoflava]RXG32060.1 hypothetical protein DSL99_1365 [Leeuwenhoekiella marinoflava]SHE96472.1 hypothetical protein SAMN02745246_01420 [Leeuwenhoekiella marinoflava DSM 3653]